MSTHYMFVLTFLIQLVLQTHILLNMMITINTTFPHVCIQVHLHMCAPTYVYLSCQIQIGFMLGIGESMPLNFNTLKK